MRSTPLIATPLIVCALLAASRLVPEAGAQTGKPGAEGALGKTYTLGAGTNAPLDLCLVRVEYRATRVKTGKFNTWPEEGRKLLVIHFSVRNPLEKEQRYARSIQWAALAAVGERTAESEAYREAGANAPMEGPLPPGKAVDLYTVMQVPGAGEVEQLAATNALAEKSPGIAYRVAGVAAKLGAPYADLADASGATALRVVQGAVGQTYEIGGFDVAVLGMKRTTDFVADLGAERPPLGKAYAFVTYQVTNKNGQGQRIEGFEADWLAAELVTAEGKAYAASGLAFRPTADTRFMPTLEYDESVTLRKPFLVDTKANIVALRLRDGRSRQVVINLASPSGPTQPEPVQVVQTVTPGLIQAITPRPPLWGFADLHAHPASHLAFGADADGNGGLFWGKPGLALATAVPEVANDLPPCSTDSHYGFDGDFVRKAIRSAVVSMTDSLTGWEHQANGNPSFDGWPSSESVSHQQMHVLCLWRAYQGGLRLMGASVTDNQMLGNLWSRIGFNLTGNSLPAADSGAELACAKRQIQFIQRLAAANADWMQVVRTPAEAEAAIRANKLALILGVEMDTLSADQILELVRDYGVRQVIPIHLANNPNFGGTAVYEDAFNTNNFYLTGEFYGVRTDPTVKFSLKRPSKMQSTVVAGFLPVGAVEPVEVDDNTYTRTGYLTTPGGHVNARGLVAPSFQKLMREGLLLDTAHMGWQCTEDAVRLAERYDYPLMDSHTGLRYADDTGESERDLSRDHARRIAALGGMLGKGTMGAGSSHALVKVAKAPGMEYLYRFTGDAHDWSPPFASPLPDPAQPLYRLRLTLTTGGDDLRGGDNDNCAVILRMRSGAEHTFGNINRSKTWNNGVTKTVDLRLPTGTRVGDLAGITLRTAFKGGFDGDNWNIDKVELSATLYAADTVGTWVAEYRDALETMNGRGVALGTDFNGLSPQLPFAAEEVPYPLPRPEGAPASVPTLSPATLGNKTYSFARDGIAHIGMLPDFVCAVSRKPQGDVAARALLRTADDTIAMWKKCVAAAPRVPAVP